MKVIRSLCSKMSSEHVVPKSFIKETALKNDFHNQIQVPKWLNNYRGVYRYANIQQSSKIQSIMTAKRCKDTKTFEPPDIYKGPIARCGLYFAFMYPRYEDMVFTKVINEITASEWHFSFPPTQEEMKRNRQIYSFQGGINIFIEFPKKPLYFLKRLT